MVGMLGMTWLVLSLSLSALAKTSSVEDTIKNAQTKFLEEGRSQAASILIQAMKLEKKESNAFKKLSRALTQVGETFVSEKAQQLFELSRSLRSSDAPTALEKLKNANELEPENEMVLRGMASLMLASGECGIARELVLKALQKNPFSDVMMIFQIQTSICLKKMDLLKADITLGSTHLMDAHKQILLGQIELGHAVLQKQETKLDVALKHLEKARSLDIRFAEVDWMTHLIFVELKKSDLAPLKEYVDTCGKERTWRAKDADLFSRSCVDLKLAQEELELRGKP